MQVALASRIKIMSNLDIAERRLPQDGRMRVRVGGRDIDLRISFLPTVHGEKCVMRILDKSSLSSSLEKIGMDQDTFRRFKPVEAALTGHQVLSTLHCNDAAGAIARMDDMGIAPFLISSSVILSCAQRLMRKVCPICKEPLTYPPKMFEDLGIDPSFFEGVSLY